MRAARQAFSVLAEAVTMEPWAVMIRFTNQSSLPIGKVYAVRLLAPYVKAQEVSWLPPDPGTVLRGNNVLAGGTEDVTSLLVRIAIDENSPERGNIVDDPPVEWEFIDYFGDRWLRNTHGDTTLLSSPRLTDGRRR
jgi:hypothetical protein